jgi:penicillin-binding protein 1A
MRNPLKISGPSWRTIIISLAAIFAIGLVSLYLLVQDLAALRNLETARPALSSQVYSSDGKLIHSYFTHNRVQITYDQLPGNLVKALIATEDASFTRHWGISSRGVMRAIVVDIISLSFREGFSTISMQLARNLYEEIGRKKSIQRKLREMITAIEIERHYSKQEIIEMYLNTVFFGHSYYGIQSASENYFDKSVEDLLLEEAALLVGLLRSPNYYSPWRNLERARSRRNVVLARMAAVGYLDSSAKDSLQALPVEVRKPEDTSAAPYFTEHVRRQLNQLQDSLGVDIYADGLTIYTTLDTRIQMAMDSAIIKRIDGIQERVLRQGKLKRLRTSMDDDSLFFEKTMVQIGMLAISPRNGAILAMVGGRDFSRYKFNRATQAPRQPGSAFKPFLYTTAIENGYTPVHVELNQPVVLQNDDGSRWTPENYDRTVGGPTSLREGLRRSLNLVAIRLIQRIGAGNVTKTARRFGLTTRLRAVPALALGTSEVYLDEMVSAYTVFANNGIRVQPFAIRRIEDRFGAVIYENRIKREVVLQEGTAYVMNRMLQNVVNAGTGYHMRSIFKVPYSLQIGGKTGTTADFTDAWFMTFTPDITAGVWVGLDDQQIKLGPGMSGAVAALPFVGEFIKTIYDSSYFQPAEFPFPEDKVVKLMICKDSNQLAGSVCPNPYEEVFDIRFQARENCTLHTRSKPGRQNRGF